MQRKTAGLLGALAGFATMGAGNALAASHDTGATSPEPMQITSYSDLLRPIPNATELLKAHDAALLEHARNTPPGARTDIVQADDHHHHHEYYAQPRYYHHHHHHHHHHHSGAIIVVPGVGIGVN